MVRLRMAQCLRRTMDCMCCGAISSTCSPFVREAASTGVAHNDDEIYDKPYQSTQNHLSNLITVSTLLLGFLITGTMLNSRLTGNENYTASQLISFTRTAGVAAILAAFTLVFSLLVSVHSSQGYESGSARQAFFIVRHSVCYIIIGEICAFVSLVFFLRSLEMYMTMQYIVPDICPTSNSLSLVQGKLRLGVDTATKVVRESSFCAQLGSDLFDAASSTCKVRRLSSDYHCPPHVEHCNRSHSWLPPTDADTDSLAALCHAFQYVKQYGSTYQYWFGYDVSLYPPNVTYDTSVQDRFRLQIILKASELHCDWNVMKTLKESSCRKGSHGETLCAEAYLAWQTAEDCVDSTVVDASRCFKVCSKATPSSASPEQQLRSTIANGMNPLMLLFVVFASFRLVMSISDLVWQGRMEGVCLPNQEQNPLYSYPKADCCANFGHEEEDQGEEDGDPIEQVPPKKLNHHRYLMTK